MTYRPLWRSLPWLAALLLSWFTTAAFAQQAQQGGPEVDPSGRVAHISARQGEVVFAPNGEDEWIELPQNRPLTDGDRLWSDRGARAEIQLDAATLHVGGETHVGVSALDEKGTQLILEQGSMNARVRDLQDGENFEIDTPNVAVRMMQPGEYRVDVDEKGGNTRVTVISGSVTVFGDGSQSVQLAAGQTASYTGRALAPAQAPGYRPDELTQWANERNRAEEQSESARYVPRGVVGHAQLDQHGDWQQVPEHGAVWYPRTVPENWAPYRQGRWVDVAPWGWTWVDEAPWGFAPFHYGRWAQINNRWAWVPGRLAPRPAYSPALVVF
ncbi:MAG: putative chromosome segregation ATPase, partial [Ramlibacter sp.]|nr:putative chromosome segregation ATPase [Ramlibacter sp.]